MQTIHIIHIIPFSSPNIGKGWIISTLTYNTYSRRMWLVELAWQPIVILDFSLCYFFLFLWHVDFPPQSPVGSTESVKYDSTHTPILMSTVLSIFMQYSWSTSYLTNVLILPPIQWFELYVLTCINVFRMKFLQSIASASIVHLAIFNANGSLSHPAHVGFCSMGWLLPARTNT